ncbi:MAG: DUF3352 domain-containing protein [bacterium]
MKIIRFSKSQSRCHQNGVQMRTGKFQWHARFSALIVAIMLMLIIGTANSEEVVKRSADDAASLLPANSWLVVTIDTAASPESATVLNRIGEALKREGLDKKIAEGFSEGLEDPTFFKELCPFFKNSIAFGMWGEAKKDPSFAFIATVSDPTGVETFLKKKGIAQQEGGGTIYKFKALNSYIALAGNYLILASKPGVFTSLTRVFEGSDKSVVDSPQFCEVRNGMPKDASVSVFLGGSIFEMMGELSKSDQAAAWMSKQFHWMGYAYTLKDDGVRMKGLVTFGSPNFNPYASVKEMPPLKLETLNKLPSGAFGFFSISKPSLYWTDMARALAKDPMTLKSSLEEVSKFEKTTGMNLLQDVMPAFNGEAYAAIYPGPKPDFIPDMLVVMGTENDAKPGKLVPIIVNSIQTKRLQKWMGTKIYMAAFKKGGTTIYKLNGPVKATKINPVIDDLLPPGIQKAMFLAQLGDSLVMSTSLTLIAQTLTLQADKSLAHDPEIKKMLAMMMQDSQEVGLIDMRAIFNEIFKQSGLLTSDTTKTPTDPYLIKMAEFARKFTASFTGPFIISGRIDTGFKVSEGVFPFDWETNISALGTAIFANPSPPEPTAPPIIN